MGKKVYILLRHTLDIAVTEYIAVTVFLDLLNRSHQVKRYLSK